MHLHGTDETFDMQHPQVLFRGGVVPEADVYADNPIYSQVTREEQRIPREIMHVPHPRGIPVDESRPPFFLGEEALDSEGDRIAEDIREIEAVPEKAPSPHWHEEVNEMYGDYMSHPWPDMEGVGLGQTDFFGQLLTAGEETFLARQKEREETKRIQAAAQTPVVASPGGPGGTQAGLLGGGNMTLLLVVGAVVLWWFMGRGER